MSLKSLKCTEYLFKSVSVSMICQVQFQFPAVLRNFEIETKETSLSQSTKTTNV